MSDPQGLEARLQQLRDAFDDSFAHEAAQDPVETVDMLEVGVGKQRFLIRVSDVRSVHAARPIARIPTDSASLLGLTGLRGAVLAVHDLGTLLGVASDRTAPWLMVARRAPIAFAFQGLQRHLRMKGDTLIAPFDGQRALGAEATVDDGTRRVVIQIDHVVEQLLAKASEREKEALHGK